MKNVKLFTPLFVSILLLIIFQNIVTIILLTYVLMATSIVVMNKFFHETFPEEKENQK